MCESNIYNTNGDLLMEDVMSVDIDGEKISMTDILNEKKIVYGKFLRLELEEHKLIVEEKGWYTHWKKIMICKVKKKYYKQKNQSYKSF